MSYPSFAYLGDALREGRLPLWDPYTSCGYPFHADPNNQVLHLLALGFSYLYAGSAYGMVLFYASHWFIGAFGAAFWARENGASAAGAVIGALSFACSGFWVGHGQHTGFLVTFAFIPYVFAFSERAVKRKTTSDALFAGVFLALSAAGYLVLTVFFALLLAVWLLLRTRAGELDGETPGFSRDRALSVLKPLLICAGVLVVFSAPQLYAFMVEGNGYTDRVSALSRKVATEDNVFSRTAFYSIFYPFSSLVSRPFLATDISMANGYVGAITLPLAALWAWKDGKRRYWFIGLCVFMVLLSMGAEAGVRTLVYYLVPPMRFIRHNATFRAGWMLPVSLAAALAVTALQRDPKLRAWFWKALAVWSALALTALVSFNGALAEHQIAADSQELYLAPLLVLALGFALTFFVRQASPFAWGMACLVALDMGYHVRTNALTVWTTATQIQRADAAHVRTTIMDGEPGARLRPLAFGYFNAHQVIKRAVAVGYTGMKSEAFDDKLVRSPFVGFLTLPFRAWLSPGAEVASVDPLAILMRSDPSAPAPALVESLPLGCSAERAVAGSYGKVTTRHYAPEQIEMNVDVPGTTPALLVTTERYGSSWKVFIDDKPAELVRTNVFFRGVWVPPGAHSVRFSYEPRAFVGLFFAAFAFLAATTGAAFWLRRRALSERGSSPALH